MKKQLLKRLHINHVKQLSVLDRFILALAVGGAVIILYFLGAIIFSNLPQDPVADHLPAEETLMYIEVNDLRFPSKLQSKTATDQNKLTETVGQTLEWIL